MSKELPQIVSDEEFDRMFRERDKVLRSEHDRWDNSAVITSHEPGDGLPECTIEQQFPRIAEKLLVVWPSEACALYLTSLIVNKRETRQGFPKEVIEDLLMLHSINDMLMRTPSNPRTATNALNSTRIPPGRRS